MTFDFDEIERNLNYIKDVLEAPAETVEEQVSKIGKLSVLTGLAAETQAQACGLMKERLAGFIRELVKEKYSATQIKMLADGEAYKYIAIYEYSVRISAGLSHSGEWIRSQISLYKTEMTNSLMHP